MVDSNEPVPSVVFAGGGTGGHISPGLAIAERLASIEPGVRPFFACSERPIDAEMLGNAGAEFAPIAASPVALRPAGLWRFLRDWRKGKAQAARILAERKVSWVVALGGFVTGPVVAAAVAARVPVLLVNLDARPGRANRWVARRATRVVSAVETPESPGFAREIVGMPIRRTAIAPGDALSCREELGLKAGLPTLFVTGASQGASSLNELLRAMLARRREAFAGWQVFHLSGPSDVESLRGAYAEAGVPARVEAFTHRIGLAWGAADLALSRAGANSVAEAAENAVPTLFAPYPYHKDAHQAANAEPLVRAGGAAIGTDAIDPGRNLEGLGRTLAELLTDPARRRAMRESLERNRPGDAAATIARILLSRP
jgi:UDP-N-acetylglucosamine--N-acetylmuramyl-(pentapeptide) pyrophosphoryl-undecaprenol N-acetylglucosamine transferase